METKKDGSWEITKDWIRKEGKKEGREKGRRKGETIIMP